MKFTSILKELVVEQSRFEILRNALTKPSQDKEGRKVQPKMTMREFLQLVQADPTTKLNNVDPETADSKELEKIKAGKYVNWLIKNYLNPTTERQPGDSGYEREVKQVKETFLEDLYKVTEDLTKYERFKSKLPQEARDINKLTPRQVFEYVKDFDLTLAKTTKAERKSAPVHPGAELMYDGENWRVIKIKDKGVVGKEAACFYGGNNRETRWCTSAPGASWFDRYIKDGPLYVVYNPNDTNLASETGLPVERYQFHFPSNQFMDRHDHSVNLVELLNGSMQELKHVFKSEFAKGLTVGGEKLVIDSFTHGAVGKFIALYGLDDLIESIPNTLKSLQIVNKDSKVKVDIKIPPAIKKFQSLDTILFENCVSSLPDEICQLKSVRFFALVNNPNLKSLPECIGDLPNLYFLNLKGSTHVKVPNSIREKGVEMGEGLWDMMQQ